MEIYKSRKQAFTLGFFAGELLMSKGAIQPDFQLENVGMRDEIPCLLDSADVIFVDLPSQLTKDVIRIVKESIFSLNDNYEGFDCQSYVRAGFLARTGILGHMVYEDARDNGYSSFLFVQKEMKNKEHSLGRITKWTDVKSTIGEWMQIPLDIFNVGVDGADESEEKKEFTYDMNKYYLKSTLQTLALLNEDLSDDKLHVEIYMDIAVTALQFGLPYMAYGFATKCKIVTKDEKLLALCDAVIAQTKIFASEYADIVNKHINRNPIELMWILEDLDITVPS